MTFRSSDAIYVCIRANALRSCYILVAEACGFVEYNALRIPSARGKSIGLLCAFGGQNLTEANERRAGELEIGCTKAEAGSC